MIAMIVLSCPWTRVCILLMDGMKVAWRKGLEAEGESLATNLEDVTIGSDLVLVWAN